MTDWLHWIPNIDLPRDVVHVWRIEIDVPASSETFLYTLLGPDERARADRFLHAEDRRRYTVARGVLRTLLSRYLKVQPGSLDFLYGVHGKPSLLETGDGCDLRFNLSHSHGLALYAFAISREVGVDVERVRPNTDIAGVSRRSFSTAEAQALLTIPPDKRREAFFACWTRKEAFIKAHGEGIALGLNRFDVEFRPGEPAALLRFEGDPAEVSRWSMRALEAGEGYMAALAVEGEGWKLRCWNYPDAEFL